MRYILPIYIYIMVYVIISHTRARARTKNRMSCCRKQRNVRGRAEGCARDTGGGWPWPLQQMLDRTLPPPLDVCYYDFITHAHAYVVCGVCVCVFVCVCVRVLHCNLHMHKRRPPALAMHNAFAAAALQLYYYSGILQSRMLNCSILFTRLPLPSATHKACSDAPRLPARLLRYCTSHKAHSVKFQFNHLLLVSTNELLCIKSTGNNAGKVGIVNYNN